MNDKIKIAFYYPIFTLGGIETVILNTAKKLPDIDFDPYIFIKTIDHFNLDMMKSDITVIEIPRSLSETSIDFICDKINELKIDIFCNVGAFLNRIDIIKERTNAKTMQWFHSMPFYKSEHFQSNIALLGRKYKLINILNLPVIKDIVKYYNDKKDKNNYKNYFRNFDIVCSLFPRYSELFKENIGSSTQFLSLHKYC